MLLSPGSLQQHFNDMLVRAKIRTIKVSYVACGVTWLFCSQTLCSKYFGSYGSNRKKKSMTREWNS